MKILIATKNKGKFNEISGVLAEDGMEIIFLGDLDVDDADFVEDGETHEANAYKKAKYYFDKFCGTDGGDCVGGFDFVLGEDSGIYVNALADELGVKTRRWGAGDGASDDEWLEYFMRRMESEKDRGAKFVCNACLIGDGVTAQFVGETFGQITRDVAAEVLPGLPLSSVFLPEGYDRVYAALTREEKNAISHRGQAISKVKKFLDSSEGL